MKRSKDYLKEWTAHGLRCRVLVAPFRNPNGYVAVPKTHPFFGKDYSEEPIYNLNVHGGITFSQQGREDSLRWPNPKLWWFGFDTAHFGDRVVYSDGKVSDPTGVEWTPEMVAEETEKLAKQLSKVTTK